MKLAEVLKVCQKHKVAVSVKGDRLVVKAPAGLSIEVKMLLKVNKQALLSYLQQREQNKLATKNKIKPQSDRFEGPLSYSQMGMWLTCSLENVDSAYNVSNALSIDGDLSVGALKEALQSIVQRHSILRTVVKVEEGEPVQHILQDIALDIIEIDLSELEADEKQRRIEHYSDENVLQSFDLANDLMIRVSLLKTEAKRHILLITQHHIVTDGWSVGVMISELNLIYKALVSDQQPKLPPMGVQYIDYACWQRDWFDGDVLQEHIGYWKQRLEGLPLVHELPTDKPRPPVQSFEGAFHTTTVDGQLLEQLNTLARQTGTTLYMVLHTAFSVLLHRYSGELDIVIGSPFSNRTQDELEYLLGLFVNTLLIRSNLSGEPTFKSLLAASKENILSAQTYQHVPFEMLVEELKPKRSLSFNPLFQIMFTLQKFDINEIELGNLKVSDLNNEYPSSKFDLTLTVTDNQDHLHMTWEYATDLFERDTIDRMSRNFDVLLGSIVAQPEQTIGCLPFICDAENQILEKFSAKQDWTLQNQTLHEMFEQTTDKTPEAVALEFEGISLTYEELNNKANQLAHYLLEKGVGQGVMVGMCIDHSIDTIVVKLAIMKAGAAYVPMDPRYPQSRLDYIVEDIGLSVLFTQLSLADIFADTVNDVICLDDTAFAESLNPFSEDNPNVLTGEHIGESLAFVIYTSGSTGNPKGVLMPHITIVNLIVTQQADSKWFAAPLRTLQFSSIGFDSAIHLIMTTFASGGTLVLIDEFTRTNIPALADYIVENNIERMILPSPVITPLAIEFCTGKRPMPGIKLLISIADQLHIGTELIEWLNQMNECDLVNHYGPSETHVVTTFRSDAAFEAWDAVPPIGRSIGNVQTYVLNPQMQRQPIGGVGELYIGGIALADGYLNLEQMTQERFIVNPDATDSYNRIYKTGDLVKVLPDGNIKFIGRADTQVKIRGYRIEMSEIELKLSQFDCIKESVVLAEHTKSGDKYLVSFLISDDTFLFQEDEGGQQHKSAVIRGIKDGLKQSLPHFMVPDYFVFLKKMPLTSNGKINYNYLRTLEEFDVARVEYIAPRTELEQQLTNIWQEVLKLDKVGVMDDFFELGGHSLLASRVSALVRDRLTCEISLRTLFENTTISALALHLSDESINTEDLMVDISKRHDEKAPLSFAQQRLWFIDKFDSGSSIYNMPESFSLKGHLDKTALSKAFETIFERHDALRAHIFEQDGKVWQQPRAEFNLPLIEADLSQMSVSDKMTLVEERVQHNVLKSFDIANDIFIRIELLKLNENHHVVLLNMHHIAFDGWSMGILVEEFCELYSAYSQGKGNPLPELPVEYADYAAWQRDWLKGDVLEQQMEFWRENLKDLPPLHSLPFDSPRPAEQTFVGQRYKQVINKVLQQQILTMCKSHNVTLFMFLQTSYAVLLGRYSNQTDVVMGTPVAGRTHKAFEGLIGCFINTLVLRTDLSGDPAFRDLLSLNKSYLLEVFKHQHIPFETLVEELRPQRSLAHSPLFQVMFTLQNNDHGTLSLPDLSLEQVDHEDTGIKYDLELEAMEENGELVFIWNYNIALFQDQTIETLAQSFQVLLEGICQNILQPVSKLPLLSESLIEKLFSINETSVDYGSEKCLHELVEARVSQMPEAIALIVDGKQVSYGELNAKSNQLANYLREQGLQTEQLVAICLERSVEMMVSILAVLKAGAAYVPVDPNYPKARIGYMLSDSAPFMVLTCGSVKDKLGGVETVIIALDDIASKLAGYKSDNIEPGNIGLTPNNLAYIIYTSGSTGQPKGVMLEHRNAVNFVGYSRQCLQVTAQSKQLQFSSFSFDASVAEWTTTLTTGATLVFASDDIRGNADALIRYIEEQQITHSLLPSALVNTIGEDSRCSSLQTLMMGGEALEGAVLDKAKACFTNAKILNGYGPTETTVIATYFDVSNIDNHYEIAIGKPYHNVEIYVVDSELQLCLPGMIGELLIGGLGVGRGYMGKAELTEEKFVDNPFTGAGKLYRSGDLVRMRADGNLDYEGRVDNQVKVRGFRIELGEIEYQLRSIEGVASAAVAVSDQGEKQLLAFVQLNDEITNDAEFIAGCRDRLKKVLPDYLQTGSIIPVEQMPLSLSGKVDRKALLGLHRAPAELAYQAPTNDIELRLSEIWQQLLKVERVGIQDNFFDLGGHSLLANRLTNEIRARFEIELAIKSVFENPTVAAMAPLLSQQYGHTRLQTVVAGSGKNYQALSFAQQRLWFLDRFNGGSAEYNIFDAFVLRGLLNEVAFRQALQAIVERHEVLRSSITDVDGTPQQQLIEAFELSLIEVDLSHLDAQNQTAEVTRLSQLHGAHGFDLGKEVLLRVILLRLCDERHVVLLVTHHIAFDGWSHGILVDEFCRLYSAFSQNQDSPLAPLPVQYSDYAYWQRSWLKDQELERLLAFWHQQLVDLPTVHSLPLDKARPAQQTFVGAHQSQVIGEELTKYLNVLCRENNATMFTLLHSAFALLLSRYSNERDIIVGSPVAGRNDKVFEGLIGYFANTLVIRTKVLSWQSFAELLQSNQDNILEVFKHQHMPFEMLVETLKPERNISHSPLFQIMFTLQNTETGNIDLPGLTLEREDQIDQTIRFELELEALEHQGCLHLNWSYNVALFEASTIADIADSFAMLLDNICHTPELPIEELDLVTQSQKTRLLGYNEGNEVVVEHACIHELFATRAAAAPNNIAVIDGEREMTYAELNRRANQLAHYLIEQGVEADDLIAICVERSVDMMVAILAVLKAGGAYVPIDPGYPKERIEYMLSDSCAKLILGNQARRGLFDDAKVCFMDEVRFTQQLAVFSEQNPNLETAQLLNRLAYTIYTSGSTGKPKGVMVEHGAVAKHIAAMNDILQIVDGQSVLQFTSMSFDVFIEQTFVALAVGATVHFRPQVLWSSEAFMDYITNNQIEVTDLPPAFLSELLLDNELGNAFWRDTPLKLVMVGGEALPAFIAERWSQLSLFGRCRLLNGYGPTETVITATVSELKENQGITIGKAVGGRRLYVLDEQEQLLPQGAIGELYIGGSLLARGYHNNNEQTQEVFVADPFASDSILMYRTGDLVRYMPNGELMFVGRTDEQLKVRGYRIEPGEIEKHLLNLPQVKAACVLLSDGNQLLACVATDIDNNHKQSELVAQLRQHLTRLLPNFMVPAAYVVLDKLPLTPVGKIDKKALLKVRRESTKDNYRAPVSPMEQQLCQIWSELLAVEQVGIDDNFFDIGGHSILALRMAAMVKAEMQLTLSLQLLFDAPTVEQLTERLTKLDGSAEGVFSQSAMVKLRSGNNDKPLFLIHGGDGSVFNYYGLACQLETERAVYAIQAKVLEASFDTGKVKTVGTITQMAEEYIAEIKQVQPHGPYLLGGHSFGGLIAFEVARLIKSAGEAIDCLIIIDSPTAKLNNEIAQQSRLDKDLVDRDFVFHIAQAFGIQDVNYGVEKSPTEQLMKVLLKKLNQHGFAITEVELSKWAQVNLALSQLDCHSFCRLDCSALLFTAHDNDCEGIDAKHWQRYFTQPMQTVEVAGNHHSMMQGIGLKQMATVLTEKLNE